MSDTVIAAIIGGIGVIVGAFISFLTTVLNSIAEGKRNKIANLQKEKEIKRECLQNIYQKLIYIINLYPDFSPNDVLEFVDYPPQYSMEAFDSIVTALDYKIEDYEKQLNLDNIDMDRRYYLKTQINNIRYSKKKIFVCKDRYFNAQKAYQSFCKSEKMVFDLYAGQNVKDCLVLFEVIINNIFISGQCAKTSEFPPINNYIEAYRRNMVQYMRSDIGIT